MRDESEISFRSDMAVELVRASAQDADVVFAARVSTKGEQSLDDVDTDASRSAGLINYLMRDRHGSPFEHNSMTFYVQAPIFVFREFMRHRVGYCLAGDSVITLQSESGLLRRRSIADLYRLWHHGVQDSMPARRGSGVYWQPRLGKYLAKVKVEGAEQYLGVFEERSEAEAAVEAFRDDRPNLRRRLLPSVRRNHVRCYDETTLRPQRAPILDVMESGEKDLIALTTATGRTLRCSVDHAIFTPDGWRKAGELSPGDHVMVGGRAPRPGTALIPPSLRRGIGVWTSMQRKKLIREVDSCYLCGSALPREHLVLDHVVPVALDLQRALDASNLRPACEACHRVKTNLEQAYAVRGGSVSAAQPEALTAVVEDGREMTYDLSVGGPWHNFLADGFVVHNSYNEESGRYRELRPVFYVPGDDRNLVQEGKPGKYVFVPGSEEQHRLVRHEIESSCRLAYDAYQRMLKAGVAREVARVVLPLTIYSSMYVTLNARSMMSFLTLRTKREDSQFPSYPQREIEMVAEKMEADWARLMPLTHAAFEANGRVAP